MLAEASIVWKELAIPNKSAKLFAIYSRGQTLSFERGDEVLVVRNGAVCECKISEIGDNRIVVTDGAGLAVAVERTDILPGPLKANLWSWRTGELEACTVNMLDHDEKYKHLGVTATWDDGSLANGEAVLRRTSLAISHCLSKKPRWDETACYLRTVVVAGMIYAPLSSRVKAKFWHQLDIRVANGIRNGLHIPVSSTRQSFYCATEVGGLELPSLVVERIASVARELQVELMGGDEMATKMARDRWETLRDGAWSHNRVAESRYGMAVNYLAGYGIYLRDAAEKGLSRVLDILAREDGSQQTSMTEGFNAKRHTHWQRYSSLSMLAHNIRRNWTNYQKSTEDPVAFWQRSLQGVSDNAAAVGRACVLAQAEARQDIEVECEMSACMVPEKWRGKINEDYDPRTGCCPIAEWLDNSSDESLRGLWVGTDGAGQGDPMLVGAGVAFKRMDEGNWGSAGKLVKALSMRLSRDYGSKVQTVRDAELRAVLVGIAKVPDTNNPLVMDAQTEWKKLQKIEQWSARRLCQGSNIPLENRLWRLVSRRSMAGLCKEQEIVDRWQHESAKASANKVGGRTLVWVRSHQTEQCVPNLFVVSLNEQADTCAGAAVACGALPRVRVPAGLPRFFYTCDGKAVVSNIGKYLRNLGSTRAFNLWKQRERHGVIPRVLPGLYKGILPLRQYAAVEIPQEIERIWWGAKDTMVNLECLVWKLRHYIGGSYTQMLHRDALLEDRIRAHEGVLVDEIRVCRVCGGGETKEEGTFRHLMMSCSEPLYI